MELLRATLLSELDINKLLAAESTLYALTANLNQNPVEIINATREYFMKL